jgi:hypothetical protein
MRKTPMTVKSCIIAIGATLALAAPAFAENTPAPAPAATTAPAGDPKLKIGIACKADLQSLCAGIEGKGGGRARCLRANQAKLSPDCAKAVAAKPAKWGQPAAATVDKVPAAAPAAAPAPAATTAPAPATTAPAPVPEKK